MNKKQVIRINESQLRQIVSESVKRLLKEGYDFSKVEKPEDFTYDEILKLVSILKENPINEKWKPCDLGWCKVQRVEASQAGGRVSVIDTSNGLMDCYSKGVTGELFIQIGRQENIPWHVDNGYTYMCWKD